MRKLATLLTVIAPLALFAGIHTPELPSDSGYRTPELPTILPADYRTPELPVLVPADQNTPELPTWIG